jgi:hypothetical protein
VKPITDDRAALLGVLIEHGVQFVLIGGAAIQSHGRRYDTKDVDIVPSTTPQNLTALADALNSLQCRLVTDPTDAQSWVQLPGDYFSERSLRAAAIWNLATQYGQLDLTFTPSGFPGGYAELAPNAQLLMVAHTTVTTAIAALQDIHSSKREANRPKDQAYFRDFENEP